MVDTMIAGKYRSVLLRLPHELLDWLDQRAEYNLSSRNSEMVRLIRDACKESVFLAVASRDGAHQGGGE
jgi:hypothetical protein